MPITLAEPIARYFAATNAHDLDAISAPFAATAVVQDEARERQGALAIREWIEEAFRFVEGRWKLLILFHLFGGKVLRFSDLERAIPAISQKMLAQQLRRLEADGIVQRTVHNQVPPKVEYRLTAWGQSLCPALDSLLKWAEDKPAR